MSSRIDKQNDALADRQVDDESKQRRVRVRVDDREMVTRYANAFRSNASLDEVMIDFGVQSIVAGQPPPAAVPGVPVVPGVLPEVPGAGVLPGGRCDSR